MSQVTRTPIATQNSESGTPSGRSAVRKYAPVLITEKQVAFSTTAAVSARSPRRWWSGTTLIARLGRMLTALTQPSPTTHAVSRLISRPRGCRGRWTDCDGADAFPVPARRAATTSEFS
jgi:hypothetical protein